MRAKNPRRDLIGEAYGAPVTFLSPTFDNWVIGVTEKSARHAGGAAVYFFDDAMGKLLDTHPTEAVEGVILMSHINRLAKSAFWDVVRKPTPFVANFNEAVAGVAHLLDGTDAVVYDYGKFKEVEASVRETSAAEQTSGETMGDQIIATDMGPASPVFATIMFQVEPIIAEALS